MKIELKKVSYNNSLSEETSAYTAQVWVDGAHICDVSNHGQGGCDMQYPAKGKTQADITRLDETIKATYPKNSYVAGGERHEYDADLETVCGDLLAEHLVTRDFNRSIKSKVLYVRDGQCYQTKKLPAVHMAPTIEHFRKKYPDAVILNTLPLEQAIPLFDPDMILPGIEIDPNDVAKKLATAYNSHDALVAACLRLCKAYKDGEIGSFMKWESVDDAWSMALDALALAGEPQS